MYCVKGKVKNLYLEVRPVGSTGSDLIATVNYHSSGSL